MTLHRHLPAMWMAWLLVGAIALPMSAARATNPVFDQVNIGGSTMQLPRGWQRQQDDYSLILTESPDNQRSALLALFALAAQSGAAVTPEQLADAVLAQFDLARHGIEAERVEQRAQGKALYRLHRLRVGKDVGYLASYSFTDSASGALIHMFFSALESRFVELGGPVLPLVVFGGMDVSAIEAIKRDATAAAPAPRQRDCAAGQSIEVCLAKQWFGEGGRYAAPASGSLAERTTTSCEERTRAARDAQSLAAARAFCEQSYAIASRVLAMSHQTSMKIAYNMGGGWCYRGESDCD